MLSKIWLFLKNHPTTSTIFFYISIFVICTKQWQITVSIKFRKTVYFALDLKPDPRVTKHGLSAHCDFCVNDGSLSKIENVNWMTSLLQNRWRFLLANRHADTVCGSSSNTGDLCWLGSLDGVASSRGQWFLYAPK